MIVITHNSIDIQNVIRSAESADAGALNVFIGTVRSKTGEKKVIRLEYEAYEPMAILELKKIIEMAKEKWNLKGWAISHRVGTLNIGDVAVVVAVSTAHRKESFEACQFIIDSLKQTVPIWKKEVFDGGEEWVSAHP
ncbi:MAG: molybdenum cofactor biosynthesis protein MoaE [Flammeovirgaceae bacterium]|jgi:molybdopterin synthase catalytic subunit|nr:molybdenum cofactor biosynthesis protein MoaE [Flammeovirgaceae bacterium]